MNKASEKIFITGATGLVGARLLPRLAHAGYSCHVLVRAGKDVPQGITSITGDLADLPPLKEALSGVTAVIHLAAVFRSRDNDLIWKSNLDGTRNLIEAIKAHAPSARFILASTAHVYNINNPHPGKEDDEVAPEHAYPASKIAAEKLLRESGLNWSVLRFPFVYGDRDGHLEDLPKHIVPAKWHPAKKMSTIHHRDIFTAMELALSGKMDGLTLNISDEAPTTVYELVKLVGASLETSSDPLTDPWHLHIDSSLARSIGFQATVRTVYQAANEGIL